MSHLLYEKWKLEPWPEECWAPLGYLAQETLLLWVMGPKKVIRSSRSESQFIPIKQIKKKLN